MTIRIRPANRADLPRLTEIYNHYVIHTPVTFDVEPYTVERRGAWFDQFALIGRYRPFGFGQRLCSSSSISGFPSKVGVAGRLKGCGSSETALGDAGLFFVGIFHIPFVLDYGA